MSLAIVFKGSEGLVLAADSRVTLSVSALSLPGMPAAVTHSTFDNATKLLSVKSQIHIGAVTYGMGALGQHQPRTAHSFLPEFEEELKKDNCARLRVKDFAERLGQFFLHKWTEQGMPEKIDDTQNMVFLVGGFDIDEPYGRVYELHIPNTPIPQEWHAGASQFGIVWGGQSEFVSRLVSGYDPSLFDLVQECLKLDGPKTHEVHQYVKARIQAPIPFQFLPLQDCVNLAILLIRATITFQTFTVGLRGVGGAIDVATITRMGTQPIQSKVVLGETLK